MTGGHLCIEVTYKTREVTAGWMTLVTGWGDTHVSLYSVHKSSASTWEYLYQIRQTAKNSLSNLFF